AVRDKIESMGAGGGGTAGQTTNFYGGIDVDGSGVFSDIVRAEAFYLGEHNSSISNDTSGNLLIESGSNDIIIHPRPIGGLGLYAGDVSGSLGSKQIKLNTDGSGQILLDNSGGTGDIIFRSGDDIQFISTNVGGRITYDSKEDIKWTTDSILAGSFDTNQNLNVTNSIIAGNDIRANAFYLGDTIHSSGISNDINLELDNGVVAIEFRGKVEPQ
ncbi:hypothetical protein LCGC14_2589850, partial [marine sediment metagenome]